MGSFYIISTPIGNMKDITFRAIETLKLVDKIVCEDTRVTNKLLTHYGIKKPLIVYHDHSDSNQSGKILNDLVNGANMALVCDAGTPGISDPGYSLITAAIELGINITSIPGPCSAITALTLSGIPASNFTFIGFLPKTDQARLSSIKAFEKIDNTIIIFESANRLKKLLPQLYQILGNRKIAITRELTKIYEEVIRGDLLSTMHNWESREPKGEFVIILEGFKKVDEITNEQIEEQLKNLLEHMSLKDAVADVATIFKLSKKKVYQIALELIK